MYAVRLQNQKTRYHHSMHARPLLSKYTLLLPSTFLTFVADILEKDLRPKISFFSCFLPQRDPARIKFAMMPTLPINHVCSIPVERETIGTASLQVPLVVRINNVEVPNRERKRDFDLHQSNLLPDTISRSAFE